MDSSSSQRTPRQLFWQLQAWGWITLVVSSVIASILLFGDIANILILGVIRPALSFVLSLGLWRIYRRWPANGFKLMPHVPAIIVVCLVVTGLDVAITEGIRHACRRRTPR